MQRKNKAWLHSWELVPSSAALFSKRMPGDSKSESVTQPGWSGQRGSHVVGGAWAGVWGFSSRKPGKSHDISEITDKWTPFPDFNDRVEVPPHPVICACGKT